MTQGERLREIRKNLGLTLEKFGERIGLKKNTMSAIETGRNALTDSNIKAVCREFNVNDKWLKTGEGEMFKELLPTDEVASYAADLMYHDESENPFYGLIIEMMRTYHELDEASRQAAFNYFRLLKKNLEQKKED